MGNRRAYVRTVITNDRNTQCERALHQRRTWLRCGNCSGHASARSKRARRSPSCWALRSRTSPQAEASHNSHSGPGGQAPFPPRSPPTTQLVTFNFLSHRPSPQAAGPNAAATPTPQGNAPPPRRLPAAAAPPLAAATPPKPGGTAS